VLFSRLRIIAGRAGAALVAIALAGAGPRVAQNTDGSGPQITAIKAVASGAISQYHLKAIVVRVVADGREVYTGALGESMNGVLATPQMHFRNGAMAFTYMATMLLELVDQKKVRLDDRLARFFPSLPYANRITLENLANMTSGYADYVYQPEVARAVSLDPFRHWSSEELTLIGVRKPLMFSPGTNWGYSHTNYVILGRVLEKITGLPLATAMQRYISNPMKLAQTRSFDTPEIPEPVLHTYSSERRADLKIPPEMPFYEESTFWNPSWTTANGAVQITDIADMTRSMQLVGSGELLSKGSVAAQIGPNLVGFGHSDPKCPVCRRNTREFNYGLGVVNLGPWIAQIKNFAGCGATVGYLPSHKLAIAVVTTYTSAAFDSKGDSQNASQSIFASLAKLLAPGTLPASHQL
jgi:CubicO group peptidase (beta-lactamase class C family)